MKKIISFVLALALCLALAAPAFAAGISGNEYAGEAQAVLAKEQPLAAAIVFERAAQAYEEAGNTESALEAYSSAGEAYEAAGKVEQAIRAYLAAKDYDKVTELFQTADLSVFSGDECLAVAAALAEQGVPASELTDIYKAAAEAFLAEANAEQDMNKALQILKKAQALADKHGDTELAAEISAAFEELNEQLKGSEFQQKVLELAENASADDFLKLFGDLLQETLGYKDMGEMYKMIDKTFPYYESAADHLLLHGYYYLAFFLYYMAFSSEASYSFAHGNAPGTHVYALFDKLLDCAEPAVSQLVGNGEYLLAADICGQIANLYETFMGDLSSAEEYVKKEISLTEQAAQAELLKGEWEYAIYLYESIAALYEDYLNDEEAAAAYREKAEKVSAENDPNYVPTTGSVLSQGSVAIVAAISSAVIFGFSGFLLGRKKKPAASSSNEE